MGVIFMAVLRFFVTVLMKDGMFRVDLPVSLM